MLEKNMEAFLELVKYVNESERVLWPLFGSGDAVKCIDNLIDSLFHQELYIIQSTQHGIVPISLGLIINSTRNCVISCYAFTADTRAITLEGISLLLGRMVKYCALVAVANLQIFE